jgi:hypothetical protein
LPKVPGTIQKAGRYHAKIRVPESIQEDWGGKEVYQKSLKTSDPRTAEKEVRAIRAIMDAQLEQAKAEEGWKALALHLPPDQKALLDNAGGLSGLLRQFEAGKQAQTFMQAGEPFELLDGEDEEALQVEVASHRTASAAMQAQANARGRVLRQIGEDVDLVEDVFSLRDLVEDWAPGVDTHTAENARTYVRRFTEMHGEIALSDLTGVHLREFTDALRGVPKVQSGKRRNMTIQQLIEDAKKAGADTIGYATQKKYFDMLKGLMSHAVGRRFVEKDPWRGMKLAKTALPLVLPRLLG